MSSCLFQQVLNIISPRFHPKFFNRPHLQKKPPRSLRARPLKSYRAPIGKARLPTTIFQGGAVQLQGAPTVAVGTLSWASTATKLGRRSDGLSSQVHYLNKGNGTGPPTPWGMKLSIWMILFWRGGYEYEICPSKWIPFLVGNMMSPGQVQRMGTSFWGVFRHGRCFWPFTRGQKRVAGAE